MTGTDAWSRAAQRTPGVWDVISPDDEITSMTRRRWEGGTQQGSKLDEPLVGGVNESRPLVIQRKQHK